MTAMPTAIIAGSSTSFLLVAFLAVLLAGFLGRTTICLS